MCGLIGLGLACGLVRWTGMGFIQCALPPSGVALGQSVYYALGTGATQAVIFQFAGNLYSRYGQHAFLGMTVISAVGLLCIAMLARRWNGGLVVREAS